MNSCPPPSNHKRAASPLGHDVPTIFFPAKLQLLKTKPSRERKKKANQLKCKGRECQLYSL